MVPTLAPLSFHWYEGVVPPFTGVAVNVTLVPAQIGFSEATMLTLAGNTGFTVMVMIFEVAGLPLTQVAFDVITQETVFPLANEAFV